MLTAPTPESRTHRALLFTIPLALFGLGVLVGKQQGARAPALTRELRASDASDAAERAGLYYDAVKLSGPCVGGESWTCEWKTVKDLDMPAPSPIARVSLAGGFSDQDACEIREKWTFFDHDGQPIYKSEDVIGKCGHGHAGGNFYMYGTVQDLKTGKIGTCSMAGSLHGEDFSSTYVVSTLVNIAIDYD